MLDKTAYFIREHVGLLKLTDTYDILDPDTQEQVAIAKEKTSGLILALRLVVDKQMLPTNVHVYAGDNPEDEDALLFSIRRGFTFLRSQVDVVGPDGQVIGWFKSKLLSIGGTFLVYDATGTQVATVKGDWKGTEAQHIRAHE